MITNKNLLLIIFFIYLAFSCKDNHNVDKWRNLSEIKIDHNFLIKSFDASNIIDTSFHQFINLVTNDSCLIGKISKIVLRNDKIIIYDSLVKQVLIFNIDGSFYSKIAAVGQGPDEYPPIVNDCFIGENYIGILVPVINKIKLYNFEGDFVKDISIGGSWGTTYFTFDEQSVFLINDWSNSKQGSFRLFAFDGGTTRMNKYLPFNMKNFEERGWGLDNHYTIYDDHALIIYSTIDTIYQITKNIAGIKPLFKINILNNKLSEEIIKGNGRDALISSIESGKITGIINIAETSSYIILTTSNYNYLFYNKKTNKIECFTQYLEIPQWGDFSMGLNASFIQDNLIISHFSPSIILSVMKDWLENAKFSDKSFENEIRVAINAIKTETENPIILIKRFKE